MDNYRTSGLIINGIDDTVAGYGNANILIYDNDMAEINFTATIDKVGNQDVANFRWGLNPELICSTSGASKITPITGGSLICFDSEGKIRPELFGYGGSAEAGYGFWRPARVYTETGAIGAWASRMLPKGNMIIGTVYGTIN